MKGINYLDEFRDGKIAKKIISQIRKFTRPANIMEVCGTHTVAMFRYGIRNILPANINLISGPGCPVCVTAQVDIDKVIELAKIPSAIIATFGDMVKVPGSFSTLEKEKAKGAKIKVVYSPYDAINIAKENQDKEVVLVAVGFETTAPSIAATVISAKKDKVKNFYIISLCKTIPAALRALIGTEEVKVNGFILPGHVSAIIGSKPYHFIAEEFKIPSVIAGFEPLDILQGIFFLLKQIDKEEARVEVQYTRAVKQEGNKKALSILYQVFEDAPGIWRGIGEIKNSGLKLKKEFHNFDILSKYKIKINTRKIKGCLCGEILRGIKTPPQCPLFAHSCTPSNAVGPCMVSGEGTCSAYYKYGDKDR